MDARKRPRRDDDSDKKVRDGNVIAQETLTTVNNLKSKVLFIKTRCVKFLHTPKKRKKSIMTVISFPHTPPIQLTFFTQQESFKLN